MNTTQPLPFSEESARCREAQRAWAGRTVRDRLRCIREFRYLLVEQPEELARCTQEDTGRHAEEVLSTDLLPTADACRFLERNAERILRPKRISNSARPLWLFGNADTIYRSPHGVVGIIGTWNYPIFLNAVQIAYALVAGNGVLWKPSELMPRLATLLHDLFMRAGFNADLFITLPATREAGPQLAEAAVDHVVFTGSADVGRRLARRLGERLISSTLELSGCDAQFLLPDANLELAAQAAWFGVTLNGGQTCLAVRRIFVHESQYEKFLEIMRSLARNAQPLKLATNPQVTQADRLVREALARGATLLDGGEPYSVGSDHKYRPTIVVNASPDMTICREGSFAPIAAVLRYTDPSELPKMNEACPFGLGASIFTSSQTQAEELIARLPVGAVTINDVIAPMGHPATPFGGRHDSGWGSTQGADGLLGMTVPQVISTRSGTFRPHYAGAIPSNVGVVRGLLKLTHARHWWQRLGGIGKIIRALWVQKGDV